MHRRTRAKDAATNKSWKPARYLQCVNHSTCTPPVKVILTPIVADVADNMAKLLIRRTNRHLPSTLHCFSNVLSFAAVLMHSSWLFLFVGILMNATASILIKTAALSVATPVEGRSPHLVLQPAFLLGVVLFAATLGCYSKAMMKLDLSVAHPIMTSVPIVLVSSYAMTRLGEPYSLLKIAGLALILTGIALLTIRPSGPPQTPADEISTAVLPTP